MRSRCAPETCANETCATFVFSRLFMLRLLSLLCIITLWIMWMIYTKDEVERMRLPLSRISQLFQFPATRKAISLHTTIKLCVDSINHIKMPRKQTRIDENPMLRKFRLRKFQADTSYAQTSLAHISSAYLRHP